MLAENIGERNVYHPGALAEASAYIEQVWQEQGYRVTPQTYEVEGISCSNLEVTRLMISLEMLGYYSERPGSQRSPRRT
jgi:hypothetical protein